MLMNVYISFNCLMYINTEGKLTQLSHITKLLFTMLYFIISMKSKYNDQFVGYQDV